MSATIDIKEIDLLIPLQAFLMDITGLTIDNVLDGQQNLTPMPLGDFIIMTPMRQVGLSTNRVRYADNGVYGEGVQQNIRSTQWPCQIDCYGDGAADNAAIIGTLIRSEYACEWFRQNGNTLIPLYCSDPHQTTMINGEQQYESRWTMDFIGQYNPSVSTRQDFFDSITVGVIAADLKYPPESP